ncbi:Amino acid/auxin permease, partial [Globisporangium splendens]
MATTNPSAQSRGVHDDGTAAPAASATPSVRQDAHGGASKAAPGFGQSLAQEVDNATVKWMKMISSTFLGENAGSSLLTNTLFSRRQPALTADYSHDGAAAPRRGKNDLDETRELKIALVGGSAVGKTSIVRRWLQRSYPAQYSPTIGVDVHSMPFTHKNERVLLHIWDVSSAEIDANASALHALLCEDLDGIFFVFNVHRVSSIAAVDKWRHSLAKYISAKEIPFFLLSHKADLLQKRVMTSDDIASYARNAGYKGWMWTVGKSNFGENDKHPAVMEALERMVEFIVRARDLAEQARAIKDANPQGIFSSAHTSVPLEVVQTDDALHQFSASLLRIPTKAITTIPRDDSVAVSSDEKSDEALVEKEEKLPLSQQKHRGEKPTATTTTDYGGNWILGNNKGVYLRATNDSFVANDETEDEVSELETLTFPFSSAKSRKEMPSSQQQSEGGDDHSESQDDDGDENEDGEEEEEEKEQEEEEHRATYEESQEDDEDDGDEDDDEDKYDEAKLLQERAARDRVNDELAWQFFAGSIDRTRTEAILRFVWVLLMMLVAGSGKDEGTFLLRRKDAQTLILSYVGSTAQMHHVLIEYANQKYHIGSSKTSQAAFPTLWKCLRSVRKYAFRGLIFTRNVDFRVVNKEELSLATTGHVGGVEVAQAIPVTPSIWRMRTRSSSSSSLGDKSASSTPTTTTNARKPRLVSGLQANQEQVTVPPKTRIDELSATFYDQLSERLAHLAQPPLNESNDDDVTALLKMVAREKAELQRGRSASSAAVANDAETQWRQLVKNMESWNRIVMNLQNECYYYDVERARICGWMEGMRLLSTSNGGSIVTATLAEVNGDRYEYKLHAHRSPHELSLDAERESFLDGGDVSEDDDMETSVQKKHLLEINGRKNGRNGYVKQPPVDAEQERRLNSSHSAHFHSSVNNTRTVRAPTSIREKLSIAAVIVHLCKGNIGPGAMSLPYGFSRTGIYAAPIYFVFVALVSVYNMDLLLYCKKMVGPNMPMSFGDVGREILGPKGKLLIDVFLVGTQLGICCVYFTFVATNIHVVLPEKLQSVIHERQLILAIFPILLLLSWVRTLKRITPFSGLANVAVVSGIAIVFYYSLDYYANPTKPRLEPIHVDWTEFPQFYGTAVYSFEGIGLILPIQNEMKDPHLFPRVLALCMLLILLLFLVIGELPTIAFGRITNGSMTAVLHDYCQGWGVTMFYPAIEVLEKSLSRPGSLMRPAALPHTAPRHIHRQQHSDHHHSHRVPIASSAPSGAERLPMVTARPPPREQQSYLPRCVERVFQMSQYECNRTIFRSMICTSLMIIAICIPDVGLLISLFGAVGSSMLAIIIPPVLYMKLHKGSLSLPSYVLHYGIVVFGILGMIAGTLQALAQVMESLFQ